MLAASARNVGAPAQSPCARHPTARCPLKGPCSPPTPACRAHYARALELARQEDFPSARLAFLETVSLFPEVRGAAAAPAQAPFRAGPRVWGLGISDPQAPRSPQCPAWPGWRHACTAGPPLRPAFYPCTPCSMRRLGSLGVSWRSGPPWWSNPTPLPPPQPQSPCLRRRAALATAGARRGRCCSVR